VPIHLRAEPGEYADAVLLPGDPLRAKYIADTYLDDVQQVNSERGLLGFTGTWEGKPVSVQGTGMGCPGATIVFEELIQLGSTKLMRVGTCGGLQAHHALGDLIVALTAVPADSTAMHQPMHVGPIVSSDLFYNPSEGQYQRWSQRGVLAVEMEAAALFTVAAVGGIGKVQGVHAGCLLTVSDIIVEGVFTRITDDELRAAVDRMTRVALATVTSDH
jgi:purine-nucleoside phosphorylase